MNRRRKGKMIGWSITLFIIACLGIGGAISWSKLMKEHKEASSLPISQIDFSKIDDGVYEGFYEGGMYKWRANKVQVTVNSGKVSKIILLNSTDPANKNTNHITLYDRVIQAQSLQVDTISGATLTSKAYLKAIENALLKK